MSTGLTPPPGSFRCWLVGVDATLLARCPRRDHDCVSVVFWLQLAIWLWLSIIFSAVVHLMLAQPGELRPELIGIAVLLASIVTLSDSYLLIRSSWHLHGLAELTRVGLNLPGRWRTQIKFAFFGLIRAMQAVGTGLLVALFIGLIINAKDIRSKVNTAYQQANQLLFQRAAATEDAGIEQLRVQHQQASDLVIRSADDASALRRSATVATPEDPEFKPAAARLARLDAARSTADAALAKAQTSYRREMTALTRRAGPDTVAARQAAEGRLTAVKLRSANARREHEEARTFLSGLRQQQQAAAERFDARYGARLSEAEANQQRLRDRLAEIAGDLERRTAGREAAIQRAVENDPAHVRRDEGLLARTRALRELANDPWIAAVIILLDLVFFSVELGAVFGKTMSFVPSEYARELAKEDYQHAYDAAHELATHINSRGPTAAAAMAEPQPPLVLGPEPTAAAQTDEPTVDENTMVPRPSDHPGGDLGGLNATLQHAAHVARQRAAKAAAQANGSQKPSTEGRSTATREGTEEPRRRGRPPGSRNGTDRMRPDLPRMPDEPENRASGRSEQPKRPANDINGTYPAHPNPEYETT